MATEKRMIDAAPIIDECKECSAIEWNKSVYATWAEAEAEFMQRLLDAPVVDAVEVIRCKNCKEKCEYSPNQFYCLLSGMPIDGDDFCSLGAKMDGEKV